MLDHSDAECTNVLLRGTRAADITAGDRTKGETRATRQGHSIRTLQCDNRGDAVKGAQSKWRPLPCVSVRAKVEKY